LAVGERALHAGEHSHRAHVRVLVETLADGDAQSPKRNVIRDLLAADGTEEDRIERLELLQAAFGNVVPVLEVVLGAPRQAFELECERAHRLGEGVEALDAGLDPFGPDAIAADGRDPVRLHEKNPFSSAYTSSGTCSAG